MPDLSKLVDKIQPSASLAISEKAKEMKEQGIEVVNLSVGQPDFDMPLNVAEAVKKALLHGKTKYTNSRGILELRKAICSDIKRKHNLDYSSEQVIVTPGAKHAILIAFLTILNPQDEVIVFEPCWHSYKAIIAMASGKYIPIPVLKRGDIEKNKQEIISKITPQTKAILINNPVNPTSTVWSEGDLEVVANVAKEFNLWVVSDEIYDEILFDDYKIMSFPGLPEIKDRTILINGFSKTYAMTGLRIGYMAGPLDFISKALKIQQHTATCACSLSQYAAVEALSPNTRERVKEMQKEYQKRRDLIYNGLNNNFITCLEPQGAFYGFLDVRKLNKPSLEIADLFLTKAKVATIPGIVFGASGEGYLRISFAASQETLKKAIENLNKFVKENNEN